MLATLVPNGREMLLEGTFATVECVASESKREYIVHGLRSRRESKIRWSLDIERIAKMEV